MSQKVRRVEILIQPREKGHPGRAVVLLAFSQALENIVKWIHRFHT